MKSLVTGGAGFIGSHLVDALLSRGDEVWALDNLSTGRTDNIAHLSTNPRFKFVTGSILDARIVREAVAACDTVYHLAAAVGVRYIVTDPLRGIVTNVQGTENVLEAAYLHRRKIVLASSSEVYGKSTSAPLREDDDRVLGPTTINRWSYSSSKAIDEHFAFAYAAKGLSVVVLRFFNSYGPRIHSNGYGTVIARFVRQALSGEPMTVHGDGRQTRCFTHVADTVRGIVAAGDTPRANGQVFNIGSTHEISVLELAHIIKSLCGSSSPVGLVPYEDYYGQSFEDTRRRVPDITRASEILGFQPRVPLEQGLRQTIAWCREHDFVTLEATSPLYPQGIPVP
ncbi:MAG TPA: GDP-mannose 4,6-dehydratase [bacterium]|nr:GDP-mannose 4,6-dehydratase [bacterium]